MSWTYKKIVRGGHYASKNSIAMGCRWWEMYKDCLDGGFRVVEVW